MVKIGITGVGGFVGYHFARSVLSKRKDIELVGLSRRRNENIQDLLKFSKFQFVQGNVQRKSDLYRAFQNVEMIYHLASQPTIWYSKKYPLKDFKANALGTVNVLDLIKEFGIKKIVYPSTCAIYTNLDHVSEDSPISPNTFYGLSKWIGERYCLLYNKYFNTKYVILRFSWVYGPRMNRHPIYDMMCRFANNKEIQLLTSKNTEYDFVYVDDAASALMYAMSNKWDNQILNISSGRGISIKKIYDLLCKNFSSKPPIKTLTNKTEKNVILNNKARKLGWSTKYSIEIGLMKTANYYKMKMINMGGEKGHGGQKYRVSTRR